MAEVHGVLCDFLSGQFGTEAGRFRYWALGRVFIWSVLWGGGGGGGEVLRVFRFMYTYIRIGNKITFRHIFC